MVALTLSGMNIAGMDFAKMTDPALAGIALAKGIANLAILSGFITTVLFFALVFLIIWIVSVNRRKQNRMLYDLSMKAMETGQPLPEGMLQLFQKSKKKNNNPLRIGIILVAVAVGISLFLFVAGGDHRLKAAAVGLVPFFIGAGYILIHFISKKSKDKADE